MLLENKTAIVFGAGGAIGGAVSRVFGREGARMFLAGRTQARVDAVARDVMAGGAIAEAAQVDALDEQAVEKYVDAVVRKTNSVDILFNAIGMEDIQGTPLVDMPFDDFFQPIRKAAQTQFFTARAVARHMAARGGGVLLTVTAGPPEATANIGGFGPACQTIEGLWRGLAAELAPRNVRVVCIRSAGSTDSPDFQHMVSEHTERTGEPREALIARLSSGTLLGRLPSTTEVAEVAVMMASDRASALTNAFVHAGGGFRAD